MSRSCPRCCWAYEYVEGSKEAVALQHNIVVLINPQSGNTSDGERLLGQFQALLPQHTYNIREEKAGEVMAKYLEVENLRVVVGGGDGTVASILEVVHKAPFLHRPHIAPLPLGTGNELARVLRWGKLFQSSAFQTLCDVDSARPVFLDQWEVREEKASSSEFSSERNSTPLDRSVDRDMRELLSDEEGGGDFFVTPPRLMNCFMSFGVDAQITSSFSQLRDSHPSLCKSRTLNKVWYTVFGITSFFTSHSIAHKISVTLDDGLPIDIPKEVEGVILLNIPSTADGTNPWERGFLQSSPSRETVSMSDNDRGSGGGGVTPLSQSIDDGHLEVIGLTGSSRLLPPFLSYSVSLFIFSPPTLPSSLTSLQVPFTWSVSNPKRLVAFDWVKHPPFASHSMGKCALKLTGSLYPSLPIHPSP
jgi:hypothetical protein